MVAEQGLGQGRVIFYKTLASRLQRSMPESDMGGGMCDGGRRMEGEQKAPEPGRETSGKY
jgi:hypothetical protein